MNTYSYLKANIDSLSQRWHDGLKDLQDITHPPSRAEHIDYLNEVYIEAAELHELCSQELHPVLLTKLGHIISRDFDQQIQLYKKVTKAK
ncbi:hypothetical protein [Parasynechococcus marenigrum]|uniref:hypothetical protein n=1 Tax=Parasynechococcus marenigrum TaxID=2881428 RepID=UPI0011D1E45E|nr:hypothetical protein [Parasynechococcus marenigrum]